ncbi:MAG: glycosyltransferase family 4 protein [Chloroflexi bacterium]|nr:glycosyltransferase family 4 protein [Chloroflexota bacterium]
MKIGLITGEYPPMEGGVGAFTQELAKAFYALGHEVHILTERRARPQTNDRDWRTLREPIPLPFATLYPFVRQWTWPSTAVAADWAVRYDLDVVNIQYQAAAYHMRSAAANFLPWRLKGIRPTVVTFHDLRVPYLFPKAGPLRQWSIRFMARHAHGVIVTNPEDYHAALGTQHSALIQIPIGSNITVHPPDAAAIQTLRTQLGVPEGGCLLGYFGFLNESKGADTLLRALVNLDERTHLVFIGGETGTSDTENNAVFLAQLRAQIQQLGLMERVHWTGFVADAAVSAHLHAADMMVMPYRDGVSLRRGTLMAVLAHGRPLITTHPARPTPEFRHGENVWLVPPDDAAALTEAMKELAAAPQLRTTLAHNAHTLADQFTWDKIATQTVNFFTSLR